MFQKKKNIKISKPHVVGILEEASRPTLGLFPPSIGAPDLEKKVFNPVLEKKTWL